jgi:lipopolysaccharide exporter
MTMGGPSPDIGRQIAVGAAWMVLMRVVVRGIGLISTIILARLLVPEDFGLVALATSIVFAVEILGQFSFDMALIRDGKAGRAHYDTAWTLAVIKGVFLALLVVTFAQPMGALFGDMRLPAIMYVLAATIVLDGLQNVGVVNFRKEMQFGREFAFMVVQKLASFCVTLTLAVLWREYWALVAGIITGSITGAILSYVMHSYRPRLCTTEWRALLGFSKWLLLNNVLHLFVARMDVFVIGRFFGAHNLGIYNVSSEIASLPTTELVAPIQRAIFPGLAKIANDLDKLRESYIGGISVLLMLAVPAAAGIAVLADPIVRVLLGASWLEAIPLLQILSLHGLIRLGGANAGSVLLALGRPKVITQLATLNLIVMGPSLFIGIWLGGLIGAAWAVVTGAFITVTCSYAITLRALGIRAGRLFAAIWRTWLSAAVMAFVVHRSLEWAGPSIGLPILKLAAGAIIGATVYVATHLALWRLAGRPRGAEAMTLDAIGYMYRAGRRQQLRRPSAAL